MSSVPRTVIRAPTSIYCRVSRRSNSTVPSTASSSSHPPSPPTGETSTTPPPNLPPIQAALLLSRPPLLQKTLSPLESAYHSYSASIRHTLSNPVPQEFYFRTGSLSERRFLLSQHQYETSLYGTVISGKAPEVGELPPDQAGEQTPRDKWAQQDSQRKEKSLERLPDEEVYCLMREKGGEGRWVFPGTQLGNKEFLHDAVEDRVLGVDGVLGGKTMDSWLVTKKPIGVSKDGDKRTFFMRSHVLAGEPKLSAEAPYQSWAWLSAAEIEQKLISQGDEEVWEGVKGMFGLVNEVDPLDDVNESGQAG